jgi:AraC family transcriptional regulator
MRVGNPAGAALSYSGFRRNVADESIYLSRCGSAAGLVVESQSRLWSLIRRAVNLLDRDRSEAWRCLRDAYTLFDQQSLAESTSGNAATSVRPGCLAAWQARRVVEYIEQHLGAKLTTEEIAAAIGLSKSHFSRSFKSTLGASPMAYVAARRIERAKRTILASAESLADVALDCGFADQSHLNRQFRRAVGVTPGQWRRSSASAPVELGALG